MTTDTLARRLEHCNAEQLSAMFDSATADQQSEIIRHRLRSLQRRLAPEDYAAVTHLFRHNLRLASDSRDSATSPRRAAQSADACRGRMETLARRVMFSTVHEMQSQLEEIVSRRRAFLAQQTVLQYHALISSLIHSAADSEVYHPDSDEDCFSARLDQRLRDLDEIDACLDSAEGGDSGWSDRDGEAVTTITDELSRGWFAGSTTVYVAEQPTAIPNVVDLCYQKLLLYNASMSPCVTQLSVYDVDEQLNNTQESSDIEYSLPALCSVADVVLAETGGHVYRLLHGLERCCSLDSPSCVLTGLVVYDRLCRLQYRDGSATSQRGRQHVIENQDQTVTVTRPVATENTATDVEELNQPTKD